MAEGNNFDYLVALRHAVVEFKDRLEEFLQLHVTSTEANGRGLPAIAPKHDADRTEIAERDERVVRAAGRAEPAVLLTNVYVMIQGVGRVDAVAAWSTMKWPRPLLGPDDVLHTCNKILGRVDALILQAQFGVESIAAGKAPEAHTDESAVDTTSHVLSHLRTVEVDQRPRVFVGSSVEGLPAAEALQTLLQHVSETVIWDQGLFRPGRSTLESLVEQAPTFDFAVLVIAQDDTTVTRGQERLTVRDNVIFELGLFIGALGRDRTFMVYDWDRPPDLPSDLAGVTPTKYRPHRDGNLTASLGPAATVIKQVIADLGLLVGARADGGPITLT